MRQIVKRMAQNAPVTAAADDEEEFEEFESEQWPLTSKEDTSLWDAEVRVHPALLLLHTCAQFCENARAGTSATLWTTSANTNLAVTCSICAQSSARPLLMICAFAAGQWDNDEIDEEFAKKFQAEMEKMENEKAEKSPQTSTGAAAEGTE